MQTRQIVVPARLAAFVVFACLCSLPGRAQEPAALPGESPAARVSSEPVVANPIVELANRYRQQSELTELRESEPLRKAAEGFAQYMARTGRYGHTADGHQPRERVAEQDYEACIVAENIGAWSGSERLSPRAVARQFVEGWKNSDVHRADLLDPDVTETGVGVARDVTGGTWYAVQLFGRPRSESIRVEIENRAAVAVGYTVAERRYELQPRVTRIHELCRPEQFTFLEQLDAETKPSIVEKVSAPARLVIQQDATGLAVTRTAAGKR
jgi:uncharacterized protein YkwD